MRRITKTTAPKKTDLRRIKERYSQSRVVSTWRKKKSVTSSSSYNPVCGFFARSVSKKIRSLESPTISGLLSWGWEGSYRRWVKKGPGSSFSCFLQAVFLFASSICEVTSHIIRMMISKVCFYSIELEREQDEGNSPSQPTGRRAEREERS